VIGVGMHFSFSSIKTGGIFEISRFLSRLQNEAPEVIEFSLGAISKLFLLVLV